MAHVGASPMWARPPSLPLTVVRTISAAKLTPRAIVVAGRPPTAYPRRELIGAWAATAAPMDTARTMATLRSIRALRSDDRGGAEGLHRLISLPASSRRCRRRP